MSGLPPLPTGETYTLWLTRNGKLADPVRRVRVGRGTTKVPLNAPVPAQEFDGWVIVRTGTTKPFLLRTTDLKRTLFRAARVSSKR